MYRHPLKLLSLAMALSMFGCGGGGSSDSNDGQIPPNDVDSESPSAQILFPNISGLWTDQQTLKVFGTASDNVGVYSVSVNGHEASSQDGFRTWGIEIPIDSGISRELVVSVTDTNGNENSRADATVINSFQNYDSSSACGPLAVDPGKGLVHVFNPLTEIDLNSLQSKKLGSTAENISGAIFDSATGQYLVVTGNDLISLDVENDIKTIISAGTESNRQFESLVQIAIDISKGDIYVSNWWSSILIKIDYATGQREEFSGFQLEDGSKVYDVTHGLFAGDGRIFTTTEHSLLELDLSSMSAYEVSGSNRGSGLPLNNLAGLSVDLTSGKAYVADTYSKIIEIDLASGERKIVSAWTEGVAGNLAFGYLKSSLVFSADQQSLLLNSCLSGATIAIDRFTGERSLLSESTRGSGPIFLELDALKYSASSGKLIAINDPYDNRGFYAEQDAHQQILAIDQNTGDRSIISGPGVGNGGTAGVLRDIAVDDKTGRIFATNSEENSVIEIDPKTGDRKLVSGNGVGSGPEFVRPYGIAADSDKNLLYVLNPGMAGSIGPSLMVVDLGTGDRSVIVQQGTMGTADYWSDPSWIVLSSDKSSAYISDTTGSIFSVDLQTKQKSLLSGDIVGTGDSVGTGPKLFEAYRISIDGANNQLLVENFPESNEEGDEDKKVEIVSVDLVTGDREIILSIDRKQERLMAAIPAVDPVNNSIYLGMANKSIAVLHRESGQYLTISK